MQMSSDLLQEWMNQTTPTQTAPTFSRPRTPSSIGNSDSESSSSGAHSDNRPYVYSKLVRWEEMHVKLLIALWKKFKHLKCL